MEIVYGPIRIAYWGILRMMTNDAALDLIESALRADPYCRCGHGTTVVARGDELHLVCTSSQAPRGRLGWLLNRLDVTHVSRFILQDAIVEQAA